ncbi:flagellin, partial [Polymorphobacter multimanifer]|uniref:flagellin n=1 Tax=Polymorphobacter multimanifer TaxID=1070431 RepID=UPI00237A2BA1
TGLAAALDEPDPTLRAFFNDTATTEMEAHTTRLADAQASLGVRGARLEAEQTRLQSQSLATASDLSRLEDTDMASAIAELQRLLTVLEAAQASFARTASQSLWDQLR